MAKMSASDRRQQQQKNPVSPGVAARFAQVALHQPQVAAVWFPCYVEDVAEDGDGADQNADAEIDRHADQRDVRNAAGPGGDGNDGREQAGQYIAERRNQTDDPVEAKAELGAGKAKGLIEQGLKALQRLVAEEPCAAIPAAAAGRFVALPGDAVAFPGLRSAALPAGAAVARWPSIRCVHGRFPLAGAGA